MPSTTLLSIQQLHNIINDAYSAKKSIIVVYKKDNMLLSFHTTNLQLSIINESLYFEDDRDSLIRIDYDQDITSIYEPDIGEVITIKSKSDELFLYI